ncbi:MAG: hypothetical protein ACRCWJ_03455 [Casimicrobium sp.]
MRYICIARRNNRGKDLMGLFGVEIGDTKVFVKGHCFFDGVQTPTTLTISDYRDKDTVLCSIVIPVGLRKFALEPIEFEIAGDKNGNAKQ